MTAREWRDSRSSPLWQLASVFIVGKEAAARRGILVDTGATLIAMNKNEARRLGLDYLVIGLCFVNYEGGYT